MTAAERDAHRLLRSLNGYTTHLHAYTGDRDLVVKMFESWYAQVEYLTVRVQNAERQRDEALRRQGWGAKLGHWVRVWWAHRMRRDPCPTL